MSNIFADTFTEHIDRDRKFEIFETVPKPLENFLYDRDQLGLNIRLSPLQLEVLHHSTQIYKPEELATLGWKEYRYVNELIIQWGKGSGKDMIAILTMARNADLLLCLRDPQGYWGADHFSNIDMINMALNADQAKFNFYEPLRKLVCKARRFKGLVDDKERHLAFAKNIYCHSGHSDEEAAEGKNLITAVLDEISAFKTTQEFARSAAQRYRAPKYSYEAMVDAMKTSIQSRFATGKLLAISYPRYKGCPIQQLYAAGRADNEKLGDKSRVFISFAATWEANPKKKKEDFAAELAKNPRMVKARYMCEPSQAEDSYIKNIDILEEVFPDVSEDQLIHTIADYPQVKSDRKAPHNFACSIHIDLGLNNCRAGLAMCHQYDVRQVPMLNTHTGQEDPVDLPLISIDCLTSFQAPKNGEIDFGEIRKFVFELRNAGYHISIISYDQWNSAGEKQILEKAGFNVVKRSVDADKSMYDDLVIMMNEHRLSGGYCVPRPYNFAGQTLETGIIKEELSGLVEVRGKRVDHRPGGSKDEADSLVGAIRGAIEFGIWKFESPEAPGGIAMNTAISAYKADQSEIAIIEQMKMANGESRLPTNGIGFRGNP